MKLHPVAPVGWQMAPAFVDYADGTGELRHLRMPVYPDEKRRCDLRDRRVERGMSLREAASRLMLKPMEFSAVERGEMAPDDWDEMLAALFPEARAEAKRRDRAARAGKGG